MRPSVIIACLSLLFGLSFPVVAAVLPPGSHSHNVATPPHYANDKILVAFKRGISRTVIDDVNRIAGGRVVKSLKPLAIQVVAVPTNTVKEKLALYRRNPYVRYAEPDYNRVLSPLQPTLIPSEGSGPLLGNYFDDQWGFNNTGQPFYYFGLLTGTADADIDAAEGWDTVASLGFSLGNPEVKVAILDTGIDCGHVDLLADSGEIKCTDIINYTTSPSAGDAFGHGTHVAGTVAANTDNAIGVAGIAEVAYLGNFKVCDDSGVCPDDAIINGIMDATLAGYQVINMSFGGPDVSQAIIDAVNYAWTNGVVLVSSAGNEESTNVSFPANLDNIIAVAASDADDNRAAYSNYGNLVSVAAPGDYILSTMPMAFCGDDPTGCYEFLSGTSMASPHVSGIAALIWARPDVSTNEQVRYIIENSADTTGAAGQNLLSWTQHGRINLAHALTYPIENGNLSPTATFSYACTGLTCNFSASSSNDPDGDITAYDWTFGDGSSASGLTTSHGYTTAGTYTVTLTVTDNQDATGSDSKSVTVSSTSNTPPTASFSYSCSGLSCTFDGSSSNDPDTGDSITQYTWDFGGSGTLLGSGGIVKYDYDSSGTYTVSLEVTDGSSATGSTSSSVHVKDKGKTSGSAGGDSGGGTADPGSFCDRKPNHPKCQ